MILFVLLKLSIRKSVIINDYMIIFKYSRIVFSIILINNINNYGKLIDQFIFIY